MYRSFISWRYLLSRRTNLIGVVGVFVSVSALILILSIMTGFLDQTKASVRGELSDLIVQPRPLGVGTSAPQEAEPLLAAIREDPRVRAASPRLVYYGILTQGGAASEITNVLITNSQSSDLMGVQLMGVDVLTRERHAARALGAIFAALFGARYEPVLQDEFDTTKLRSALVREGAGGIWSPRVPDPDDPFAAVPQPGRGRPKASVVVGEQLARQLYLQRGDTLSITTAVVNPDTGEVEPSNREFVVAGTFRTREHEADRGRIYLDRRELSDFLGGTRSFSEVQVQAFDYERQGHALRDDLRVSLAEQGLIRGGVLGEYEVKTWEDFRRTLLGAIENERVLMAIMLNLVLVVAGFTLFAILSMMVTEKRKDIGILCAVGATRRGVMQLFLMIAFWDALIGATFGAVAGIWGALKIDSIERWLSRTFGIEIFDRSVYYFDHIPSRVEPGSVTLIVLGAFACSLLFALVPAWRAARLDPLEALRYE